MLVRFATRPERVPAETQSCPTESRVAVADGWTFEQCEIDSGMHFVTWGSFQAVCVPRMPLAEDRLRGCLSQLLASPHSFDELADLLDLVILLARHEGVVRLYSSAALNRCIFFAQGEQSFTLSDRLRALRRLGTKLSFNEQALSEFLTYRFITPPATLLKGIFKIPPGQMLTVDLNKGVIVEQRSTLPQLIPGVDAARAARDLDLILQSEMLTSCTVTAPPRVLLSGGMDSTLLASVLRAQCDTVLSYSTGFEQIDPANREMEYAQSAAEAIGAQHQHIILSRQHFLNAIIDATAANEEPIHHLQSAALLHLFASIANRSATGGPVFCGEAADGLFGNDTHDLLSRRMLLLRCLSIPGIRRIGKRAMNKSLIPRRLSYLGFDISKPAESPDHLFWSIGRYVSAEKLTTICSSTPDDIIAGRRRLVSLFPDCGLLDQVTLLSFLTEGFATMSIWSRIAASQGDQMIYPFASPVCLRLALGMAWSYKLRTRKTPIAELLKFYGLPSAIRERPKQSFGLNPAIWAPKNGLMQPLIDSVCTTYDPGVVAQLQRGDRSDVMLLWNIISLELWSKLVLEEIPPEDLKAALRERMGRISGVKDAPN